MKEVVTGKYVTVEQAEEKKAKAEKRKEIGKRILLSLVLGAAGAVGGILVKETYNAVTNKMITKR